MTSLGNLTQRLQTLAEREGRSPEAILEELLDAYEQRIAGGAPKDPIDNFIGIFDDDVTDLSATVRETLHQKFTDDDSSA